MRTMLLQTTAMPATSAVIAAGAAFSQDLWDRIQAFDCDVVTRTFAERSVEYGHLAAELEVETKRFLYLAALMPEVELAPTKPIDDYWHQFVLFTGDYHRFCQQFGGAYIEHNPLAGPNHAEIFANTQRLVREQFGDDFAGIQHWTLPMPATSCKCTNAAGSLVYGVLQ